MESLTILEAFKAMTLFLENFYKNTNSDDIGGLLGDMILLEDDKPIDPAIWEDWIKSVEKVKKTM